MQVNRQPKTVQEFDITSILNRRRTDSVRNRAISSLPNSNQNVGVKLTISKEARSALQSTTIKANNTNVIDNGNKHSDINHNANDLFNILNSINVDPTEEEVLATKELATYLADAINATLTMKDATIEERAMQREAALKMAEQMAQNLNQEDALKFMSEVNRQLEQDMQRERGYVDEGTRRPHEGSDLDISNGTPNFLYWVEGVMDEESRELWERASNYDPFDNNDVIASVIARFELRAKYGPKLSEMQENGKMEEWINDKNLAFDLNVEQVNNTINTVSANFDSLIEDERFLSILDWQNNMDELLEKLNLN